MAGRPSRREKLLESALVLFKERGYEATSVAHIAAAAQMTKAAFSYHFPAKDDLLFAIAGPLLADLAAVVDSAPDPDWPEGVQRLLQSYLAVLIDHIAVVEWIDGDKALLRHPVLGARLQANDGAMRRAIAGGSTSRASVLAASATLGTLWRPLRNVPSDDMARYADEIVATAMAAAAHARLAGWRPGR